jgi:hypothetical protein
MKARPLVLSLLIAGVMTVGTVASRSQIGYARTAAIVNFVDPVLVTDRVVMGPVLIVHDDEKMALGEACTTFYRFDPDRSCHPFFDRIFVCNGLAFSPDGRTMYLADTHPSVRTIWACDYDVDDGVPTGRRVFVDTSDLPGRPDGGSCVPRRNESRSF